jgi:hypothetical protein
MEHKICKGCRWNKYPLCEGTRMDTEKFMNIENLKTNFKCGQKDRDNIDDLSFRPKTEIELRIEALEEKTKDLKMEVR